MDVTIREVPAQDAVSIRMRTQLRTIGETIGDAFGELYGYLARVGVAPGGAPTVVYLDMDPHHGVDVQICVPVRTPVRGEGRIESVRIPGGPAATTIHRGSYETLEDAYAAVRSWAAANGHELTAWMMERYLSGPGQAGTVDFETEIVWPLEHELETAGA